MSLQEFLAAALQFLNSTIIPLLLAVAFVIFLFNVARYFIIQEDKREEARSIALWGILAFVVIASIWGITNLLVAGLDLDRQTAPCPDYNPNCQAQRSVGAGSGDGSWNPGGTQRCVIGISCQIVDGVRTCESCFWGGN